MHSGPKPRGPAYTFKRHYAESALPSHHSPVAIGPRRAYRVPCGATVPHIRSTLFSMGWWVGADWGRIQLDILYTVRPRVVHEAGASASTLEGFVVA